VLEDWLAVRFEAGNKQSRDCSELGARDMRDGTQIQAVEK
jgi:hypothetical protein